MTYLLCSLRVGRALRGALHEAHLPELGAHPRLGAGRAARCRIWRRRRAATHHA